MHEVQKEANVRALHVFVARRECATAFLQPWTTRFFLATKTCLMDLMGTCVRGHAKCMLSDLRERWSTASLPLSVFTEQNILSNLQARNQGGGHLEHFQNIA